jgi:hypothetical protein
LFVIFQPGSPEFNVNAVSLATAHSKRGLVDEVDDLASEYEVGVQVEDVSFLLASLLVSLYVNSLFLNTHTHRHINILLAQYNNFKFAAMIVIMASINL